MPQMANITVKKNDGTTDIVYNAKAPSSGDKTAAIWAPDTVGTSQGFRPEVRMTSQSNSAGTVRYVDVIVRWPSVTQVAGVDSVTNRCSFSAKLTVPATVPDSEVDELVSQSANLMGSTLFKDAFKQRYAPS